MVQVNVGKDTRQGSNGHTCARENEQKANDDRVRQQ